MEEVTTLVQEFEELIDLRQWKKLREELEKLDPAEIAELIEELDREGDSVIIFRLLPRETARETFSGLNTTIRKNL